MILSWCPPQDQNSEPDPNDSCFPCKPKPKQPPTPGEGQLPWVVYTRTVEHACDNTTNLCSDFTLGSTTCSGAGCDGYMNPVIHLDWMTSITVFSDGYSQVEGQAQVSLIAVAAAGPDAASVAASQQAVQAAGMANVAPYM
jgi:hypothetical protein